MKIVLVLAMHGMLPCDFPREEAGEFFALHGRLEHASGPERTALERRHAELEAKMRIWPRTSANDPFYGASQELAAALAREMGCEVIVGFNEFCAPTLDEALDQALARGAERVVVTTPMMTRGGEHSEVDIPAAIQRAQGCHPESQILYAWPFTASDVAGFLAKQIRHSIPKQGGQTCAV